MTQQAFHFEDCEASFDGRTLTVRNAALARCWRVSENGLLPLRLLDAAGEDWLLEGDADGPALLPVLPASAGAFLGASLDGRKDDDLGFARPHLRCELLLRFDLCEVKYCFWIYPQQPLVRTRIFLRSENRLSLLPEAVLDALPLRERHCEWEAVFLRAVTDSCNNLVQTQRGLLYPAETQRLSAGILRLRRTVQGDGLFWIKESPGGSEQTRYSGVDFTLEGGLCRAVSAGYEPEDVSADEFIPLYGCALGLYDGGELGFYRALRQYHEARHLFRPGFDGAVLSNTWGDNSRASKINEEFLLRDIDAAHTLGVTHYQIDAGWDDGLRGEGLHVNLREVNRKNLPHGFEPLLARLKEYDMQLGLWLEPYSDDGHGYACYRRDAESIIRLYREYGATFFKLDGFKLPSYTAAWHFEQMLRMVLEETDCAVYFNIDITNWPRTGYFCGTQYGNFFLANRYTDWGNYYTHLTQKNLWELCRYVPAYRIQAECPNTARNAALYERQFPGDPLAPQKSGQGYALASVLAAAPLAWFEPCEMDAENRETFASLLRKADPLRQALAGAWALPIGDCPNGACFTGFQLITGAHEGYLLLLKGKTPEALHEYRLYPGTLARRPRFETVAAATDAGVGPAGPDAVAVMMDGDFRYALIRYFPG